MSRELLSRVPEQYLLTRFYAGGVKLQVTPTNIDVTSRNLDSGYIVLDADSARMLISDLEDFINNTSLEQE